MKRFLVFIVLFLGVMLWNQPLAMADTGGHTGLALALDSWPVLLAALCGLAATHLTEVFTKYTAPQWVKSGVNLALVTLGGVLATIATDAGKTWKDYVGEIFAAWVVSILAHTAGLTAWIEALTANTGIGGNAKPLVTTPSPNPARDDNTGTF